MNCPDCKKELGQVEFRDITIHECVDCKGRWFDRDELRKAKDNADEDLRWLDFDPFGQEAGANTVEADSKACPKCSTSMSSLTYDKSNVVIEKCSQCHGVWVHCGEFEKIIRYLEDLVSTKTAPGYVKNSVAQFLEIVTGPEGVVAEVKDFLVVTKLLEVRAGVEHPHLAEAVNKIYQYFPFI
ncbi:MAG: zf-TFIIB domain-containing protein [Candidatus Omnitrophica bacterium]|nr:zf-TFIIB domain-containing protein [Candidatus Omnitrophota bacterium]